MGGLKLGVGGSGSGGPDNRNALLQSIQMGAKLKKVQTVDKSGPLIAGKVGGSSTNSAGTNSSTSSSPSGGYRRPSAAASNGGGGAGFGAGGPGAPKLGGIFEGLSSMPKLKPVGSRGRWPSRQFVNEPKNRINLLEWVRTHKQ